MPLGKGAKPFRGGQVGQGRGPGRPALLALVNGALFLLVCLVLELASQALFPRHLLRMQTARPIGVVNAGVPSDTSPQVLLCLKQLLPRYRAGVAVVSVLWNDVLYSCLGNGMPEYRISQQPAPWRQFLLRHAAVYRAIAIHDEKGAPSDRVDNPKALRYYAENLADIV